MLQLKNAALESAAGKRSVHALRCLNLVLPETGLVVLTGASGSGKTALLHLLAMTEAPSRGEILVYGENTARWNEKRRAAWRREIAAADEALLFEDLTLGENAERAAVLAAGGPVWAHKWAYDGVTFAVALRPFAPDWRYDDE